MSYELKVHGVVEIPIEDACIDIWQIGETRVTIAEAREFATAINRVCIRMERLRATEAAEEP
jgi:hypothetical protein